MQNIHTSDLHKNCETNEAQMKGSSNIIEFDKVPEWL